MSGPGIHVEHDGSIATVTLSNPEKLNAITVAMWREFARAMHDLSAVEDLRCIVLRGAGDKAFAAGADIEEFARVRDNVEQGKRYHREDVVGALKAVDESLASNEWISSRKPLASSVQPGVSSLG